MRRPRLPTLTPWIVVLALASCTSDDAGSESDGGASGDAAAPRSCSDGVMNGGEADVDCGGPCPTACGEGATCDGDADCASGFCHPESGACAEPYCGDDFQNGDETDVDCGGSCDESCSNGDGCRAASDCKSGSCDSEGVCAAPSCTDGLANQDETGTDCGGSCGATCADGERCEDAGDCEHGFCTPDENRCATPACDDGYLNQDETDLDCGGSCGATCADGRDCEDENDCATGLCHPTSSRCAPGECANGELDPDETDTDCGGVCGPSCEVDEACLEDDDCASGFCHPDTELCATPTCSDGFRNQDETDTDCGGDACGATCDAGESCREGDDCADGFCNPVSDACAEPTCDDGFRNQDETDTDCGGECGAGSCDDGQGCAGHDDCESGFCNPDSDACAEPSCSDGYLNKDETDVDCGNGCGATCEAGESCDSASGDCAAGLDCVDDVCQPPCEPALDPVDDGSSAARRALVISEIHPGEYIELWNATDADIALSGTTYQLCSRPSYQSLSTLAPGVTVPSFGYATVPWPDGFDDGDAGGEIALYLDSGFSSATSVMDFVCWGTNPHQTRKTEAESGGKWSGACASALGGGAIHREPDSDGTSAADYDVASAPSPLTCTPD